MSSSSPHCSLNAVHDSIETNVVVVVWGGGAVIVQVPVIEQTWPHLQGSVMSLTHFVPSRTVASLPENTCLYISQKFSSSKLVFS